jgi:hypothetical protein
MYDAHIPKTRICIGVVSHHPRSLDGCPPITDPIDGDVWTMYHLMWPLWLLASVLYAFMLRDIAMEVRGE